MLTAVKPGSEGFFKNNKSLIHVLLTNVCSITCISSVPTKQTLHCIPMELERFLKGKFTVRKRAPTKHAARVCSLTLFTLGYKTIELRLDIITQQEERR